MWECNKCHETFHYYNEIVLLLNGEQVENEEHGGSGDYDTVICLECYEEVEKQ